MDDGPRALLLALGPLPLLMASLHPTHIFVNSVSLNCPENIVTEACHLFPDGTLIP